MAASPSSSMSLSVFIATFRIWIGSSWTLWMTKQIHIVLIILWCTVIQVNYQPVSIKSLLSSPCCPLHHTGQGYLPLGRLDLGEESPRSSSTGLLCSCRGEKSHKPLITLAISPLPMKYIQVNKDWPGELLEGAESDHGSHALARGCKRCVKQNVTHAGNMHHAVVVKVGWEWHPRITTDSNYNSNLTYH